MKIIIDLICSQGYGIPLILVIGLFWGWGTSRWRWTIGNIVIDIKSTHVILFKYYDWCQRDSNQASMDKIIRTIAINLIVHDQDC